MTWGDEYWRIFILLIKSGSVHIILSINYHMSNWWICIYIFERSYWSIIFIIPNDGHTLISYLWIIFTRPKKHGFISYWWIIFIHKTDGQTFISYQWIIFIPPTDGHVPISNQWKSIYIQIIDQHTSINWFKSPTDGYVLILSKNIHWIDPSNLSFQ